MTGGRAAAPAAAAHATADSSGSRSCTMGSLVCLGTWISGCSVRGNDFNRYGEGGGRKGYVWVFCVQGL